MKKQDREKIRIMFGGRCAYCGCILGKSFHADHVKAVIRQSEWVHNGRMIIGSRATGVLDHPENDTIDNMFPSCAPCNLAKMDMDVDLFRSELEKQVERARKTSRNFRFAEKYGLVQIIEKPIIFWFEQFRLEESKELE